MDEFGRVHLHVLLAMLVGIPAVLAVIFGLATFRRMAPLAFHCLRCDTRFQQRTHRRFPRVCPRCGAADWNIPREPTS